MFIKTLLLTTVSSVFLAASPFLDGATLLLQLQASNYNASTGTWTATVGSNATQATVTARPSLATGVTANGSSAVRFDGDDQLVLTTPLANNNLGYTVFAYIRTADIPGNNGNGGTILGGTAGSLQYRVVNTNETQGLVRRAQQGLGNGTTSLSTTTFSSINATAGTTAGSFRLNGAADGAVTGNGANFSGNITNIGAHDGSSEFFLGDIAEIRLYSGIMTDDERIAVEAELNAAYAVPEPASCAFVFGALGVFGLRRHRSNKR